jgi:hypothetical protein
MHPTILSRRVAPAASVQSSYLTLSGCVLLPQGGPGVRLAWHRWQRQELRREQCTARRIGGCDNHCDDSDEQLGRASHGRRGRDVRYARTIKETQAKPASLIPPEPTTKKSLSRIFGAATPLGALVKIFLVFLISRSVFPRVFQRVVLRSVQRALQVHANVLYPTLV